MKNFKQIALWGALSILLATNSAQAADQADLDKLTSSNACQNCNLLGADLSGVDLSYKNLKGADLGRANLTNAIMEGVHLERASLAGADLTGANLVGAHLSHAELSRAKLVRVDLTDADMSFANVNGTILIKSNVTGASFLEVHMGDIGKYDSNTECRTIKPHGSVANQDCKPN